MSSLPRRRRFWGHVSSTALLMLTLLIAGACGTGNYNDRMDRRIQELNSSAAEQPDESDSDEAAADTPAPRQDDSDDELLEDDVPELDEPPA